MPEERYSEAARIVGQRIRSVRLKRQMSQEEVAEVSEMHVTNYGKIERGKANPSLTTLVRIANALAADPGEFVKGIQKESVPERKRQLTPADIIHGREKRDRRLR
ncbi:MAG TPA: helix-turn-helix transcriptional regulator [Humibacter sp.]|nr:helix-turn-helix transcriptional regulator [Humibacter sp.]